MLYYYLKANKCNEYEVSADGLSLVIPWRDFHWQSLSHRNDIQFIQIFALLAGYDCRCSCSHNILKVVTGLNEVLKVPICACGVWAVINACVAFQANANQNWRLDCQSETILVAKYHRSAIRIPDLLIISLGKIQWIFHPMHGNVSIQPLNAHYTHISLGILFFLFWRFVHVKSGKPKIATEKKS